MIPDHSEGEPLWETAPVLYQCLLKHRLFKKVVFVPSGCWEWTGIKTPEGYGRVRAYATSIMAHRLMYHLYVQPLARRERHAPSDGSGPSAIDHCENKSCVRPGHLELVTYGENTLRSKFTASGANARKTHCKRGHALGGSNLKLNKGPNGKTYRQCRICLRAAALKYALPRRALLAERLRDYRKEQKLLAGGN